MPTLVPDFHLGLFYHFRGPTMFQWGCETMDLSGSPSSEHGVNFHLHNESIFNVHKSWRARRYWHQFFDYYHPDFQHALHFRSVAHLVELVLRLKLVGLEYFKQFVNCFDAFLVPGILFEFAYLSVFRTS